MGRNNTSQRAHAHVLAACRAYDLTVAAFASQQASSESGESCSSSTDVNALLRELQAELGISAKDAKAIDETLKQRCEELPETDDEAEEEEDESGSCRERSDAQWIEVSFNGSIQRQHARQHAHTCYTVCWLCCRSLQDHNSLCHVCTRAGSSLKGSSLKYCDTCSLVFHHSCVRPALPSDHATQSWSCTHCILERNRPGYSSGSNSYSVLDTLPLLADDELDVYRKALNQMKKLSGMYLHAADGTDGKRQRHLIQPAHYKGVTAVVSNARTGECVYEACFQDKGALVVIGTYDDAVAAAKARDSCARKLYGLCAPLNYPSETEETARNKTAVALSGLGLKLVQGGDATAVSSTASNTYSMASGGRKCIRRRIVAAANNAGSGTDDVNATAAIATNASTGGHSDVDSEADDTADDQCSKVRVVTITNSTFAIAT
jgi:PHD-finger